MKNISSHTQKQGPATSAGFKIFDKRTLFFYMEVPPVLITGMLQCRKGFFMLSGKL